MADERYARQFNITYDYLVAARVTAVHPVNTDRRLRIDAAALDGRAAWSDIPISLPEGVSRNYRRGQIVALAFRYGSAQFPIAVGHLTNLENPASGFGDPLPAQHQYVDDHVLYHAETGAFIRFRNTASTAAIGGGDGQPVKLEIATNTGHTVVLDETPGAEGVNVTSSGGHKFFISDVLKQIGATSAAGHKFLMDDIEKKISHVTIAGHTVDLDDIAGQIKMVTTGGEEHVLDAVKHQVSTLANSIGLGNYADQLASGTAAITKDILATFSSSIDAMRLQDMITLTTTLQPYLNNGAAALAAVQALVLSHLSVPNGSTVVKVKE